MNSVTFGTGVAGDPWILQTPSQTSSYEAWREDDALFIQVGKTQLSYLWRGIEDAHAMLIAHDDWMPLGNADEGKPTKAGTLEHWARDPDNPIGGYYGRRKGYRGRFANYVSPVMEMLGLVELEHNARNNRLRAK